MIICYLPKYIIASCFLCHKSGAKMKRICVFCGSNYGMKSIYSEVAKELGRLLAEKGITLVYGGGNVGLMGEIANSVLTHKGEVIGVMPKDLVEKEIAHKGLTKLHVVNSMHERKAMMAELSCAFIALPGGFGTFEEFFEAVTWSQLGLHKKACGVLNVEGFYNSVLHLINNSVTEGFIRPENATLVLSDDKPDFLLEKLANWNPIIVDKWIVKS